MEGVGTGAPELKTLLNTALLLQFFYLAVATVPVKVNFGKEQYTMVHPVMPGLVIMGNWVGTEGPKVKQEGQNLLTGQRAANFRLSLL